MFCNQARALQYCLEEDNNILEDDAWIVHLDEETLLTEASVRGIMNFITADKHSFGQGMFIILLLFVRFYIDLKIIWSHYLTHIEKKFDLFGI